MPLALSIPKRNIMKIANKDGLYSSKIESLERKFGKKDLLPLWVADMDFEVAHEISGALTNRSKRPIYPYTIYPDEYFNAIINWLGSKFDFKVEKDDIIPSFGVVNSINLAIKAFSNVGDKIIVQTPIYPPFINSVKRNKREILDNKLIYKDGKYSIDFGENAEGFMRLNIATSKEILVEAMNRLHFYCQKTT